MMLTVRIFWVNKCFIHYNKFLAYLAAFWKVRQLNQGLNLAVEAVALYILFLYIYLFGPV